MLLSLMLVSVCLVGCGEIPEMKFASHPRVDELMPPAQEVVKSTIDKHFGEPDAIVAWSKLPVEFGMLEGEVTEIKDGAKDGQKTLTVELDETEVDLQGDTLEFYREDEETGEDVADFLRVLSYDAESGTLVASGENFPEEESEIFVGGHGLKDGQRLYMKHCLHCHGVTGDGDGPTANYLNPKPRDFRLGLFKYKSTDYAEKPSHADLMRTLDEGIAGTYMPSFKLLEEDEKKAIVEYVRWLSMRGEIEKRLIDFFEAEFSILAWEETQEEGEEAMEGLKLDFQDIVVEELPFELDAVASQIGRKWELADDESSLVKPTVARVADTQESRLRGQKYYVSSKCITCHGPLGYGDGSETETYKTDPLTNVTYSEPGLYDAWGTLVKPRNLRLGQFRGGRRPIDVFRRIKGGIPGTPMQAFSTSLKDEEIWDVVNYVLSLPHSDPAVEINQRANLETTDTSKSSLAGSEGE